MSPRWTLNNPKSDTDRLRLAYHDRTKRFGKSDIYSLFNSSYLFMMQQRERQIINLLKAEGLTDLTSKRILEVGCGRGTVLLDLIKYGANSVNVYGIDLIFDRLQTSKHSFPLCEFANADGQKLPFESQSFDILLQFTAFSSILDPHLKQNMAADMLRVLKPNGVILWYDFWWNPTNPQTAGIRLNEIKDLFLKCQYTFRKITLAPPITRRIVPFSYPLALLLESIKVFNSHYLVLIKKKHN